MEHSSVTGVSADRADEGGDRANLRVRDLRHDRVERQRAGAQTKRAARDRWDQRHLVPLCEGSRPVRVLAVDGVEETRGLVAEGELGPDVGGGRTFRQLELARARPRSLAETGKGTDRALHDP